MTSSPQTVKPKQHKKKGSKRASNCPFSEKNPEKMRTRDMVRFVHAGGGDERGNTTEVPNAIERAT